MKNFFSLLAIVLITKTLPAQDTIRTLIISEARIDIQHSAYVELTNVGNTNINLSQFEFGKIDPWTTPYEASSSNRLMLPAKILAPGKSFVIAKISDWISKMWAINPEKYNKYESKPEFLKLADLQIHIQESFFPVPQSEDSISIYSNVVGVWNGAYCWYLKHHVTPSISVVVDQVNGIYDDIRTSYFRSEPNQIAGIIDASLKMVLIRKANIKKGNTDFSISRGTNQDESEWILIPFLKGNWEPDRAVFWTVGNHGDYHLNSLSSAKLNINWTDSTLKVPWGIRNDDSIMYKFNRVPGIAWHYDYSGVYSDSAYTSVRTGDKLTLYACGNKLEKITFKIILLPPVSQDNKVLPKKIKNLQGFYKDALPFCEVSDNVPGMDTISGLPFACRLDTFFKYLEKPQKANWEIKWIDGLKRPDLKKGDILKVVSENGTIKEYYIKPKKYYPSHNANLSAITWPDIPPPYRGIFGWKGDTIPNFTPDKTYYKILIPYDVSGVPAIVGLKQNINSKIQIQKLTNIKGSAFERTVTMINTAEDDTTTKQYSVEFSKEKDPCCIQKWEGEPFLSEYVFQQDYNNNFCEIYNPGSYNIDLSNYMITFGNYTNANEAITRVSGADAASFKNRYNKYIPGYKWVDEVTWNSTPGYLIKDTKINPILYPGKVFVMADIYSATNVQTYPGFAIPFINIDFHHNPWGDNLSATGQAMKHWYGHKIMLFKILNDSIKLGLKAANDPKDFKLIDVFGDSIGSRWVISGYPAEQNTSWKRKPHIFKGNPIIQLSFGTNQENSEWDNGLIYTVIPIPWPENILRIARGIGTHNMNEITFNKSTVTSEIYKISEGYSVKESIKGLGTGITLSNFYKNIIKADTGQHLKVKKVANGSVLNGADIISQGDTLIVVSCDSSNTTKYIIDLTLLSNDALLTSYNYIISVDGNNGTISNFNYGTKLKEVFNGVIVPPGAHIIIINSTGGYQPLKNLNCDTLLVDVMVNDQIFFEVTAENGNKITYQLKPNSNLSDAFVTSNVYNVYDSILLIAYFPNGISVKGFYQDLIPAPGATLKLLDKYGTERLSGYVCKDDKLLVTSKDGKTKKIYYLTFVNKGALSYHAYILSNDYEINQINLFIKGDLYIYNTNVSVFKSKITPAFMATFKVVDKFGVEKSSSDLIAEGDEVIVKSADGLVEVKYYISFPTTIPNLENNSEINIYPNPSFDNIYINGLVKGNTIQIYNITGKLVTKKIAHQLTETIVIKNLPSSVYIIKISGKNKKDHSYRIVKN